MIATVVVSLQADPGLPLPHPGEGGGGRGLFAHITSRTKMSTRDYPPLYPTGEKFDMGVREFLEFKSCVFFVLVVVGRHLTLV